MYFSHSNRPKRQTNVRQRWLSSGLLRRDLIALMMEAARTSETLVNFYQTTWRNNPEDNHLRTLRRENLKSYKRKTTGKRIFKLRLPVTGAYLYNLVPYKETKSVTSDVLFS
jgi:hypothetical protein